MSSASSLLLKGETASAYAVSPPSILSVKSYCYQNKLGNYFKELLVLQFDDLRSTNKDLYKHSTL